MVKTAIKKLAVPAVSRADIDAWNVTDSGLPLRIVNVCRRSGIATVGDLRAMSGEDIMQLRSLGARSLKDIEDYFVFCRGIERGSVGFKSVKSVFAYFLNQNAMDMLAERHALRVGDDSLEPGATLDAIGRQFGLTRERVRQQMSAIYASLQTKLARICFTPLLDMYADFLREHDGVASTDKFEAVPFRGLLDGLNPARLLLLMTTLYPTIILRGSLFTLLEPRFLEDIEKIAVDFMHSHPKPQGFSDVVAEFEEQGWFRRWPGCKPDLVMKIVAHAEMVGATREGLYFLFPEGAVYLLATLISEYPRPVPGNILADRFNEEVIPVSRRDTAYIIDLLNRSFVFVRGRDGKYRLRK